MRASTLISIITFSFSLADIPLSEDLFPAESFPTDSNLYLNDDWQDSGDSTLAFNDVVHPADVDIDFMTAGACDGGNGNLNKLRLRENGNALCPNPEEEKEGPIVPQIFQPGDPVLDQLESTTKPGSEKCPYPPLTTNVCCNGFLGELYSRGSPQIWSTISDCYPGIINFGLSSSATTLRFASLMNFDRIR